MIRRCCLRLGPFVQKQSLSYKSYESDEPHYNSTKEKIASLELWRDFFIDEEPSPEKKTEIEKKYNTAIQKLKDEDAEQKYLDMLVQEIVGETDPP